MCLFNLKCNAYGHKVGLCFVPKNCCGKIFNNILLYQYFPSDPTIKNSKTWASIVNQTWDRWSLFFFPLEKWRIILFAVNVRIDYRNACRFYWRTRRTHCVNITPWQKCRMRCVSTRKETVFVSVLLKSLIFFLVQSFQLNSCNSKAAQTNPIIGNSGNKNSIVGTHTITNSFQEVNPLVVWY